MSISPKQANRRYFGAVMGGAGGYVASVFAVTFASKGLSLSDGSGALIALSILPGLFLLMMIWAVWRYLTEVDEVVRHQLTESMMIGLFAVLAFTGGWGLVELYNDTLPKVPLFYVFPGFFMAFGLASWIRHGRCV